MEAEATCRKREEVAGSGVGGRGERRGAAPFLGPKRVWEDTHPNPRSSRAATARSPLGHRPARNWE